MGNVFNKFAESKKEIPEISYELPGSKEQLLLRPFTTKEQKAILKAIEKEDQILVGEAFDQLLRKCVINKGFKPEKLFSKDRECLLIKLRQESVKDEYVYHWKCKECGEANKRLINLNDIDFSALVEGGIKEKEITLENYDSILVLGISTREDEKNILSHAKRNSGPEGIISEAEILNGAYACVIKGLKIKEKKIVKDENGNEDIEEKEQLMKVSFEDRIKILESLSPDEKKKIKDFFDEIEEYGYDLALNDVVCGSCGHEEEEHEMDWISFFTRL